MQRGGKQCSSWKRIPALFQLSIELSQDVDLRQEDGAVEELSVTADLHAEAEL